MKPLQINFAVHYKGKRNRYRFLPVLIVLSLIVILGFNGFQIIQNQQVLKQYRTKIGWLKTKTSVKPVPAMKKRYSEDQIKQITDYVQQMNRIIIQDTFPWSRIFDLLEDCIPASINLTSFSHVDDFTKIILEGESRSLPDISRFLAQLNQIGGFQNSMITHLKIAQANADSPSMYLSRYRFTIETTLQLADILQGAGGLKSDG